MTSLIAYRSRRGSTEQYARWLGEETGIAVNKLAKLSPGDLARIQVLVIGSNVRIGRIEAGKWIENHWGHLSSHTVILFSVSLTPPDDEEMTVIYERSVPEEIRERITYFPLPGRFRPQNLPFLERQMIKMVARAEEDPRKKAILTSGMEGVNREALAPVIRAVREAST